MHNPLSHVWQVGHTATHEPSAAQHWPWGQGFSAEQATHPFAVQTGIVPAQATGACASQPLTPHTGAGVKTPLAQVALPQTLSV